MCCNNRTAYGRFLFVYSCANAEVERKIQGLKKSAVKSQINDLISLNAKNIIDSMWETVKISQAVETLKCLLE